MLVENLFNFEEVKCIESRISAIVSVNAGNEIYAGHFSGNPITPGVLQVQLVQDLLSDTLKRDLLLSEMISCKFLAIWNPETTPAIEVEISFHETENGIKVNAHGGLQGSAIFKLSAIYS